MWGLGEGKRQWQTTKLHCYIGRGILDTYSRFAQEGAGVVNNTVASWVDPKWKRQWKLLS